MATNKTYKGAFKPMGKSGHFDESMRHSLQAKGFKTGNLSAGGLGVVPPQPKGRLVVKEYRVYHFDDLPEKAKEKALENYRDINVDFDWWDYDGLIDLSESEMKESGIQALPKDWFKRKLMADGTHNEGVEYPAHTGLFKYDHNKMEFDFERYNYLKLNGLNVTDDNVFRKWLGVPKALWDKVEYVFEQPSGDHSTYLEFHSEKNLTAVEQKTLSEAHMKFQRKMKEGLDDLRKEYERRLSDEEIAESFRANEYEFNEEGKIN
jgi:hypothetical protein